MSNGALFYKADLHIHSYGPEYGSFDVTDISNTPQAIVDTAIEKGLKVISITDHNQYLNSMFAVQYSKAKIFLLYLVLKLVLRKDIFYYILKLLKNFKNFILDYRLTKINQFVIKV